MTLLNVIVGLCIITHTEATQHPSKKQMHAIYALSKAYNCRTPGDLVETASRFHQQRNVQLKAGTIVQYGHPSANKCGYVMHAVKTETADGEIMYKIQPLTHLMDEANNITIASKDIIESFPKIVIHWIDHEKLENRSFEEALIQYLWNRLKFDDDKDTFPILNQFTFPLIASDQMEARKANQMKYHQCWMHLSQVGVDEDLKGRERIEWIKDLMIECCPKLMNDALKHLDDGQIDTFQFRKMYNVIFGEWTRNHPSLKYVEDVTVRDFVEQIEDEMLNALRLHLKNEIDAIFQPLPAGLSSRQSVMIKEVVNHYIKVHMYSKKDLHIIVPVQNPHSRGNIEDDLKRELASNLEKIGILQGKGVASQTLIPFNWRRELNDREQQAIGGYFM